MIIQRQVSALTLALACVACMGRASEDEGNIHLSLFRAAPPGWSAWNALMDVHEHNYPKVTVTATEARLAPDPHHQSPPELFQTSSGPDITRWITNGKVESLNQFAEGEGWLSGDNAFHPDVVEHLSSDGNLYAAPLGAYRLNTMFVNKRIFDRYGVKMPTTLDELYVASEALLALDPPIVPMTLGSEYPWTLGLLFVDDLLIALMGAEAYTAYFSGQYTSGDDQKLREMLTHAGRLWRYMPKQSGKRPNEISWQEGINHFIAGEVAMTFMGDWAKPLLDNAGMIPGLDYEQLPFPGTLGTFVVSVDALAMPIDAPSRRLAVGFLKTARSEEGQVAFNVLGSIPVRRLGPDAAGYFDVAATRTLEEFWAAGTKCPLGWHALVPELYADLVSLALHDFTVSCAAGEGTGADTCDPEPAMATFIGNYDRLRVTQ